MAKVNIISEEITSFGGIYYAGKAFYALSLDKVINAPPFTPTSPFCQPDKDKKCNNGGDLVKM